MLSTITRAAEPGVRRPTACAACFAPTHQPALWVCTHACAAACFIDATSCRSAASAAFLLACHGCSPTHDAVYVAVYLLIFHCTASQHKVELKHCWQIQTWLRVRGLKMSKQNPLVSLKTDAESPYTTEMKTDAEIPDTTEKKTDVEIVDAAQPAPSPEPEISATPSAKMEASLVFGPPGAANVEDVAISMSSDQQPVNLKPRSQSMLDKFSCGLYSCAKRYGILFIFSMVRFGSQVWVDWEQLQQKDLCAKMTGKTVLVTLSDTVTSSEDADREAGPEDGAQARGRAAARGLERGRPTT